MWARRSVVAFAVASFACGPSSSTPARDAGPDEPGDAAVDAAPPLEPAAPAPPALPVLTPCPEGWREVPDDATAPGLVRCDPWPATGRATCRDDQAHFPGTPGCAVVGTPCAPDDDWATDLPANAEIIYVKAGRAGGSGLRSNPFGDLQVAIEAAEQRGDTIVALSKGTYDDAFTNIEPVTLWGACTAETVLTRSETVENGSVLEIGAAGGTTIRNLRFSSQQASLYVHDTVAPVVVDSVVMVGRYAGLFAEYGATVDLTNLLVRDTAGSEDGLAGHGVFAIDGAHVSVDRGLFVGNRTSGATAIGEGTELTLRDTALLDTLPEDRSGLGGMGVQSRDGARVTLDRVVVQGGQSGGAVAMDPDSSLDVTDLVVRDVQPTHAIGGSGLVAQTGGQVAGRRIDISGCSQVGLYTLAEGAHQELEDVVVTDTRIIGLAAEYGDGVGLSVGEAGSMIVRRVLLARNADASIAVVGADSSLTAEDVTVLDTGPGAEPIGLAVGIAPLGTAQITRLYAARASSGAVQALGALVLTDAVIEHTRPLGNSWGGWGLVVGGEGRAEADRVVLRELMSMGLSAWQGGQFVGRDVVVERISPASDMATGVLAAQEGSSISLTTFRVTDADVCGVQVGLGGALDLRDGEVRGSAIGANVQDRAFDLARIQEGVRYVDNGVNLDTTELPLPSFEIPR